MADFIFLFLSLKIEVDRLIFSCVELWLTLDRADVCWQVHSAV